MKNSIKVLSNCGLAGVLLVGGVSAEAAAEKPKSMEDMWKIIEAQQKQIDTLVTKLEKSEKAAAAKAETKTASGDVKGLERKTDVLSEEVEKLRTQLVIPEQKELKSAYGLGPAASKVYQAGKGLSIGGYGEARYQAQVDHQGDSKNNADFERAVLYVGYKFTDKILFNSELEFEHGTTGEGDEEKGEVSVEFASLDFFINPLANVRAGMVLLPMGFINRIHEPPFYFGNHRPQVEQVIIPTTWNEDGVGLFGELAPGLTYTTYVVNGLDANGFESSGIREGRQHGGLALAEDLAFTGRLDYAPAVLPGMTFGGSAYLGNSGQNQEFAGQKPGVFTQLYEAHLEWKYRGWEFRTLGSWGFIGDAAILSAAKGETIGSENYGWYTELGYNIMPLFSPSSTQYLAPFFRYEMYDTIAKAPSGFADNPALNQKVYQVGVNYKPIPNVVIKADYRNFEAEAGYLSDDFNLGLGFIF